jgi:ATP/ADP translocase
MVAAYLIASLFAGTTAAVIWLVIFGNLWAAVLVYSMTGLLTVIVLSVVRLLCSRWTGNDK